MVFMDAEFMRLVLPVEAAGSGTGVPPVETHGQDAHATMWVEAAGSKRVIERYAQTLEELGRAAGAPAAPLDPAVAEHGWGRIVDFRAHVAESFPDAIILRAAFLISRIDDFVNRARQECERAKARLAVLAQPGSGVVHLLLPEVSASADRAALVENLRNAASGLGGALVVERCSPEMKSRIDVWGRPGSDFEIMRKLKHAWDPKGILSPGRFVGGL